MLRASRSYELQVDGHTLPAVDQEAPLTLRWPNWYPSDAADRQRDAQTIIALVQEGLISRENGYNMVAVDYNIEVAHPPAGNISEGTA
jgi:hypothetical protein